MNETVEKQSVESSADVRSLIQAAETAKRDANQALEPMIDERRRAVVSGDSKAVDAVEKRIFANTREIERQDLMLEDLQKRLAAAELAELDAKRDDVEQLAKAAHTHAQTAILERYPVLAGQLAGLLREIAACERMIQISGVELPSLNRARMRDQDRIVPISLSKQIALPLVHQPDTRCAGLWNPQVSHAAAEKDFVAVLDELGFNASKVLGSTPRPVKPGLDLSIAVPDMPGKPFGGGYFAGEYVSAKGERYALVVAPAKEGRMPGTRWWPAVIYESGTAKHLGATAKEDGLANTRIMTMAGLPIAAWATGLRIGGADDWHIPSKLDADRVIQALASPSSAPHRAAEFQPGGSEEIPQLAWWTSTEHETDAALAYCVTDYTGAASKTAQYAVLAVRKVWLGRAAAG